MNWNYNISEAPKSYEAVGKREIKGESKPYKYVYSIYILAALPGCERVGKTQWLPVEGRWEGLSKGEEPVAWMLWPKHPRAQDTNLPARFHKSRNPQ